MSYTIPSPKRTTWPSGSVPFPLLSLDPPVWVGGGGRIDIENASYLGE